MDKDKKILILQNEDYDVVGVLVVDKDADINRLEEKVKQIKKEIPDWQVSDIIEELGYEETFGNEVLYI